MAEDKNLNNNDLNAADELANAPQEQQPVEYTDDNIRHLSDMEHVRTRPGMYIGRLGDGNLPEDGIYVLLKEVVDNSIDEFKMGAGARLEIDIEDLTMPTIYNYSYYPEHIEALEGFTIDNKYVEYKLMVPDTIPDKYAKIAAMIEKRYNLHVRKLTRKDIYEGGFGQKIFDLINDTYKHLYGYSELSQKQIDQYIKMYLSLLDLNFVTAIEDWTTEDHKMIGIGITMPSLSRALQKCHRGRLFPFGWWHLLRAIKFHKTKIVDLLLIGIQPEYRAKGANALLFADLIPIYQKYGIEWGETQVEMEDNAAVQGQWGVLDPVLHKRRNCYIKSIK
jgi:hypothetical protein